MTSGYALFYVKIIAFVNGRKRKVAIFKSRDTPLPLLPNGRPSSFHSLLAVPKEEVYEYYALIIAIISLLIIVIEKAISIWQQVAPVIEQVFRSLSSLA